MKKSSPLRILAATVFLSAALSPETAHAQITVGGNGSNTTDSTAYTGAQTLTKVGTNTVTLTGSNTYTGGTTVSGGTLAVSGQLGNGNIAINGGTLAVTGNGTNVVNMTNGNLSITNGVFHTESAHLQSLLGPIALNGATISASGASPVDSRYGILWLGGTNHAISVTGDTTSTISAQMNWAFGHTFDVANGTATVDLDITGRLMNEEGFNYARILKTGEGTMRLANGNNSIAGTEISGGEVIFRQGALGRGVAGIGYKVGFFGNSTLTWETGNTEDITVGLSAGSYIGDGVIARLNVGTNNVNLTNAFDTGAARTGALVKTGTGTLTLGGNNTYTGATTVSAGQLTVDGSITSTATVRSGARIGGSGCVGGLILESGSILTPGNSPGTLSVNGDATWNSGANYNWQVYAANTNPAVQTGAGTGWDLLDVSGSLTFSGLDSSNRFNLNLWSLSSTSPDTNGPISGWDPNVGSTWLIASAAGGINLNGTSLAANTNYSSLFNINTAATNGTGGWSGALPSSFQVLTLGDANALYLQAVAGSAAVPEPGQVAASLLLLAGIGGYVWLKRRKAAKPTAA